MALFLACDCDCVSLCAHLTPLINSPLWAGQVIAGLDDHPLELTALPVHQATAQIIHTIGLSATTPTTTCLGALHTQENSNVCKCTVYFPQVQNKDVDLFEW